MSEYILISELGNASELKRTHTEKYPTKADFTDTAS